MNSFRTKEEQVALLEDTVKFYSEDVSRRATIGGGACFYFKDGKKCAVGRWIDPAKYNSAFEGRFIAYDKEIIDSLIEDKQGFHPLFWIELQDIHDRDDNWDENGLTQEGKRVVNRVRKAIWEGEYLR